MNGARFVGNIMLSVLILWSSTGMTTFKHFCMGELQEVSVYKMAKSCMEKMDMDNACPAGCCETTSDEVKADNLQLVEFSVSFKTPFVFYSLFEHFQTFKIPNEMLRSDYLNYKPPLIKRDVPILVQSFLI